MATLSKNLEEEEFEPLRKAYGEEWKLLTGKQVFPYRFLRSLESMKREGLVSKEWFGSQLQRGEVFRRGEEKEVEVKPISDEDYNHYVKVMQAFGCKTFGEYVKLYCSVHVELLAILFEKFVKTCVRNFGIDPSKVTRLLGSFGKRCLK